MWHCGNLLAGENGRKAKDLRKIIQVAFVTHLPGPEASIIIPRYTSIPKAIALNVDLK